MNAVVGLDIGGSSHTAVAFDQRGSELARSDLASSSRGGDQLIANILRTLDDLGPLQISALGVGIPGQVDVANGDVRTAVNLGIGEQPYPLAALLEKELGYPVTIENDVRAAALGVYEKAQASIAKPGSVTFVNIGTGIAAGAVINGAVVRGSHGLAGEIGHVVMDIDGPTCRCGQKGCLEAIAAGPAIAMAWPIDKDSSPASALFSAAAIGESAAITVANRITGHLVTALTWLAATYDTEDVVIGGGVSQAGPPFLAALRTEVARRAASSDIAARRLRPEQVTLVDPESAPGSRGAWVLASRRLSQEREMPAISTHGNDG